ncbi:MAG: DNA-formamidopyrimidine glycosylase [Anaerolineaceae bacterium]|jgi:formamidopyrimidine-DNA glycosylase|nr:MAG: DNA-formamidopyrimidine glycosylase [Anaerolineaceae bacterium]
MPELPEVETIVRAIKPELIGRTVLSADVLWARTVATSSANKFKESIRGQRVVDVARRAKYLDIILKNHHLLIHLRMSGDIIIRRKNEAPEKHDRLILHLSSGKKLAFNDTRKFGRVWLTDQPETVLGRLGPEPLGSDFTPDWLYENLRKRKRQLKPLLLDQTFLAGVGNIYADESLHLAKLHPLGLSNAVTKKQAEALCEAIRSILREGIRRNGSSIDWVYRGGDYQNHFRVYDREGKPCPVCGTKIQKLTVGQRGTHVCPKCQRLR